ncbi:MAG: MFS transporter [Gemmataceae bacterium]
MHAQTVPTEDVSSSLTQGQRWSILVTACLGWLFAGFLLSTTSLAMRSAAIDLLDRVGMLDRALFQAYNRAIQTARHEKHAPALTAEETAQLLRWRAISQQWFAYYQCAMLFGAATGGFVLGRLGDRIGRSRAMACSILCYSLVSAAAYFVQSPVQLLVLWFTASLGLGGMWPTGVALLNETWSGLSRPLVAGLIGTSANIGILALSSCATHVGLAPDHWRWMLLVCAAPCLLGLIVLMIVPESPRWLAAQAADPVADPAPRGSGVFRSPLLGTTLLGITLATIPMIGAWGSANWMVPWAAEAGEVADPPNLSLQAQVSQYRSLTGIVGSLLGGWVAHLFGRRFSYALISLAALVCAQVTFWQLVPTDPTFLIWVSALGFFSGIYFGWMPLFLPELFPTRCRSTGAGVSFNFGRILTAVTIFATGLLTVLFHGDYAQIGRLTSLIFVAGLVAPWFAPDTSRRPLED